MFAGGYAIERDGYSFSGDWRRSLQAKNAEKLACRAVAVLEYGALTSIEAGRDRERHKRSHCVICRDIGRLTVPMQGCGDYP